METNQICLKVALIGDSGVGKSSISSRYAKNLFNPNHQETIGLDFNTKIISISGIQLKFQIFDLTSRNIYWQYLEEIFEKIQVIIIVFDKHHPYTLKNVKYWMNNINLNLSQCFSCVKFLVGNKTDLECEVSYEEGLQKAKKYNLIYVETSAKDNQGIKELFEMVFGVWADISLSKD